MRHMLKGLAAILVLGALLSVGWFRYSEFLTQGMKPTPGTQRLNEIEKSGVPDFTATDLTGQMVSLSQFKDKTVILNFWASWCDPCVEEFPSMVKLIEFFQGRVVMLAVSADAERAEIDSFLKPYQNKLPKEVVIIHDPERKIPQLYGTEVLPESYIFARGLRIIRKVAGSEDWFAPGAVQLFHEIVSLEPSASAADSEKLKGAGDGPLSAPPKGP